MGLVGDGVLGVWHGIAPGMERAFDDWYNDEHNAERVAIDGFLRARRYVNLRRGRRYFCRYDTRDVSVLGSPAYLEALNNPSARSRSNFPHYRNTLRGAFRVVDRQGWGDGGYVLCCRFGSEAGANAEALSSLAGALLKTPAVSCVEQWVVDASVTNINSQEKALRRTQDAFPEWVMVIDGTDPEAMESALQSSASRTAVKDADTDLFRLVLHIARRE